jgi:hypothetical protein
MTEGTQIAMTALIVDFQRLHYADSDGGFFRLIAQLQGLASGESFLQSGHHGYEFLYWTAAMGVQHMRQDHWPFLTHIRYKALPHLPGGAHIGHGPVQGGRHDPEFAGNGSETVVAKAIACLGQG